MKLLRVYVDDIFGTVRGDQEKYSKFANPLQNKLQTVEKVNMEVHLAFPDINVKVSSKRDTTYRWYQKPTDTGIKLYICSCALLQHKKNEIQGTVRRVLDATSNRLAFDQALQKKKTCWNENQYPEE